MISYREVFTTKGIQWVEETERAQEYLEASCRRFGKLKTSDMLSFAQLNRF
jgi:hypothetical protein